MEEEIKRFTERLYNETFGNGQGTLDEFDWEDIATVIEETAHHFVNWQKERQLQWKPSEEQIKEYDYWYRNFIKSGLCSPTSKAVLVLGEILEQLKKQM